MKKYALKLQAEYHQFYVQDDDIDKGNLSESWSPEASDRLLAVAPFAIGIGTVQDSEVSVFIEVHASRPQLNLNEWQQVNICSLKVETGSIVVAGCTDYFPDAYRIAIESGTYEAIICYRNLDQVSDIPDQSKDSYHLFLYPGFERPAEVLKSRGCAG